MSTIVAFILIKYIVVKVFPEFFKGKVANCVCFMGSLTFGIYLLDPILKKTFYGAYESVIEGHFPTLIVSIGWCVISMLLGGVGTYLLKKVPIIRKCF